MMPLNGIKSIVKKAKNRLKKIQFFSESTVGRFLIKNRLRSLVFNIHILSEKNFPFPFRERFPIIYMYVFNMNNIYDIYIINMMYKLYI